MDEVTGLPLSFGRATPNSKAGATQEAKERIAKSRRVEQAQDVVSDKSRALPTQAVPDDDLDGDEDEDDAVDGQRDESFDLPVSHEVVLKDHTKTVSALSIDPAGARICTGGYDYDAKLWDFGGMDASFKPFMSWEPVPEGSYQVHDIKFNNTGDKILVASATSQIKMFDRQAEELGIWAKGDMYIRDLRNTAGHVAEITTCSWHPKQANTFLTASNDSTIRIWDVEKRDKSKYIIVVKSKDRGQRTKITSAAYSDDGRMIAAAGSDGAMHVWNTSGNFVRPNHSIENAHTKGTTTSGLTFSLDNHTLVSRGGDDTVKLWDVRSFKKPLAVREGLRCLNQESNVIFSPDENYILVGTAGSRAGADVPAKKPLLTADDNAEESTKVKGNIVVMRRSDLSVVRELGVSEGSVVKVLWHPRINQILASTSLGAVHVLYSPESSLKGATMSVTRKARKRGGEDLGADGLPTGTILTPHALPMFKDDDRLMGKTGKRKREKERQDAVITQKPLPPIKGPGRGGRVGASATQHVVQNIVRDSTRDEDPREALLKFANSKGENGDEVSNMFTNIYAKTQPKPIFAMPTEEELEREEKEKEKMIEGLKN